jgi:hypothetical protein
MVKPQKQKRKKRTLGVKKKKKNKSNKALRSRKRQLSLEEEALRASPDMSEMLKNNDGKLFVPYDMKEEVVAQPKNKADVEKFMKRLSETYGLPLAAEHAMAARDERHLSRPQTPIGDFGEYISNEDRMTWNDNNWRNYLNMTTGSTIPASKTSKGGKRKSRKKRRRKRKRRRKTKRKSRRRRK